MLGISISFRLWSCFFVPYVFFAGLSFPSFLNANDFQILDQVTPKHYEKDWVLRYFESIDEDTEIGEIIDFLVTLRESLIHKGYKCPSLMELAINIQEYLIDKGIEMDEEAIQEIIDEIARREQNISLNTFKLAPSSSIPSLLELCKHKHKHKHDKHDKEAKISSGTAVGFVKFLGGALLCIVPIPAVQAVGITLAGEGIAEMIMDAKEQGDENERLKKLDEQRRRENEILGS